jgi:restriction endonuclease Mrr
MQGRADKGLIITTGTFTAKARKEATSETDRTLPTLALKQNLERD